MHVGLLDFLEPSKLFAESPIYKPFCVYIYISIYTHTYICMCIHIFLSSCKCFKADGLPGKS